ncbi:MAG TPA: hypothetical protein VLM11_21180, partial [Streptosporangiaceae bacterium]|nr:hypothetical protein [Streptosporangiaceae bacterium]
MTARDTAARYLGRLPRVAGREPRVRPGGSPVGVPRRAGVRPARMRAGEQVTGWAFVTPATVVIMLFGVVPIAWSAIISFQRNNLFSPNTPFVGLSNYRQM